MVKCYTCGKTFTRCGFMVHKPLCSSPAISSTKQPVSSTFIHFEPLNEVETSVAPETSAAPETSIEENAIFMVIDLNKANEPIIEVNDAPAFQLGSPTNENLNNFMEIEEDFNDVEIRDIQDLEVPAINGHNAGVETEVIIDFQNTPNNTKGYTKKGQPRKRSAPLTNSDKTTKLAKQADKHKLKPPCYENLCKRKCTQKISEDRRKSIHEQFWKLEDAERKMFILSSVNRVKVKRVTVGDEEGSRKQKSFFYSFTDADGETKIVCKTFFLTTLGYNKTNDTAVFNVLKQPLEVISPREDRRGKHPAHNKIDKEAICEHILKYNPCVHHYRREHAPNRKYLPTDVNITMMYSNYAETHPNSPCSYELYRKTVSELNISFSKLGHEECEKCEIFQQHNVNHAKEPDESCSECQAYIYHKIKFEEARANYQSAVDKNAKENYGLNKTVVFSVDLQKVLMLPQIDEFKECIFTKRIIALHESFVPVGTDQTEIQPVSCVWHEGVSGRKQEDICSCIYKFMQIHRDSEKIVLWMDNCSSQNKNWALFSFMVYLINSDEISATEIEFDYLEPGHTFMSADSFHHQVAKQLKLKGKVYDFQDFCGAVQNSNSKRVTMAKMEAADFFLPFDFSSLYKISKTIPRPYLANIVQVCFNRGSFNLKYKTCFSGDPVELNFVKQNFVKNKAVPAPPKRSTSRGVNKDKKEEIVKKLVPLMPMNRRDFWLNLEVSDASDMITEIDV